MLNSSSLSKQHILGLCLSASLALGTLTLIGTVSSFATQPVVSAPLRGTSGPHDHDGNIAPPVDEIDAGALRGVPEDYRAGVERPREPSFLNDIGSTFLYLRDNLVPVLLFRGTTDAVSERDVTYTLPAQGPLRYSMMHSANVYDGLRGGTASVGDTVSTALRGSYTARAQMQRANADRARIHSALGNFLPRIEVTLNASRNSLGATSSTNSSSTGDIVGAGIQITMPLYTSGVNRNLYRQARHVSSASDYTYLAEEHRVALEAITAHVNLRLNRRVEQTLARNVVAMQKIANVARRLFDAGDTSRTDIAIAVANVESARAERDLARKTREETKADYESVTGKQAPKTLGSGKVSHLVPPTREEAVDLALQHNPTLAAAKHTALASKHAAKVERGRFGPQVNLSGNYNRDLYRSVRSNTDQDWSVGVQLRVPLFDATMAPNVNAAQHEAVESGYRALDQARQVERQVERQWTAYRSATRRLKIVQRQVNSVRASVNGARREFEAGFRSVTDVLNEQVKLARAQITLENVRHERMLAAYELAFTTASPELHRIADASWGR